jgi:hypothetical protein
MTAGLGTIDDPISLVLDLPSGKRKSQRLTRCASIRDRYPQSAVMDTLLTRQPMHPIALPTEDRKGLGRRRKETVKGRGGLLRRA